MQNLKRGKRGLFVKCQKCSQNIYFSLVLSGFHCILVLFCANFRDSRPVTASKKENYGQKNTKMAGFSGFLLSFSRFNCTENLNRDVLPKPERDYQPVMSRDYSGWPTLSQAIARLPAQSRERYLVHNLAGLSDAILAGATRLTWAMQNEYFGRDIGIFAASPCANARLSARINCWPCKTAPQMLQWMFGPRFLHGYDGQCSVRAAILALLNYSCTILTGDNAMFEPRLLHGYGRHRRKIAIANAHCPFGRGDYCWANIICLGQRD